MDHVRGPGEHQTIDFHNPFSLLSVIGFALFLGVDPGNIRFGIKNTPKIVGGLTDACLERATELYGLVCEQVVPVTSPEVAEVPSDR